NTDNDEDLDFEALWKALDLEDQITDLTGIVSESHNCVDCGFNTHPGALNRAEMEKAFAEMGKADLGVPLPFNNRCEVYMVRAAVWKKAGMEPYGGCLCIGCLEKRIGRRLKPKDFPRKHPFNDMPGTPRLLQRRGG